MYPTLILLLLYIYCLCMDLLLFDVCHMLECKGVGSGVLDKELHCATLFYCRVISLSCFCKFALFQI